MKKINVYIKNGRLEKGLKTRELAQMMQIDQALISKFENGNRMPTRNQVMQLSDILDLDVEEMLVLWTKEKILKEINPYDLIDQKAISMVQEEIAAYGFADKLPLNPSLQKILNEIDDYKEKIDALRHLDSFRIAETLELEYTYESNKIEGNTLTLQETNLVVHKGLTISGKSMQEHLEAINHIEAIDYIKDLATKKIEISEREILAIHHLILMKIDSSYAGKYRNVSVVITGSTHLPPQPYLVPKQMEDLLLWYIENKNKLHPVVLAAEMHLRLVTIHPFIDGNGRTSRLLMNLIMIKHGYPIANIKGDDENRMKYYSALEKSQTKNDDSDFLLFVANTALESIKRFHFILS
ncbi:MAG: Fic family protein [Chitinophagales bacterium]